MKLVDKFMLKSYVGPFIMTFFIAVFVFFMIFVFKYVDDFVGKGLDFTVLMELFFYFSLTTIPMALPLAILLSSLMTFGNLGEHFELTALKSAGIPLQRILASLVASILVLCIFVFYFSNTILPYTNLKAGSLLYDIRSSKPALMFKEGAFNTGLEGFSIKIGEKSDDGKMLKDILIYDHREMKGNNVVLSAKEGRMEETPDKHFLELTLLDGASYKEVTQGKGNIKNRPLIRDKFAKRIIRFDVSGFSLKRTKEELFKSNYQMMDLEQLSVVSDSLETKLGKMGEKVLTKLNKTYYKRSGHYFAKYNIEAESKVVEFDSLSLHKRQMILEQAYSLARSARISIESQNERYNNQTSSLIRFQAEWHRKFTLSVACLVLFFIGAPLGAIIRKGGLGMPVLVSIIFFLTFHILSITGEKLARSGDVSIALGMWMATLILLPLGIYLTYKATKESSLFNMDSYVVAMKKLFAKKEKDN